MKSSYLSPIRPLYLPVLIAMTLGVGCASESSSPNDSNADNSADPTNSTDPTIKNVLNLITPTELRGTIPGGNATGVHGCVLDDYGQQEYHHYEHGLENGTAQLHVVSTYVSEQGVDAPDRRGDIAVDVTRPGKTVLILSAYDSINWNVTAGPEVTLERIIATGHDAPSVTGPEGVPVVIYSASLGDNPLRTDSGNYEWPSSGATDLVEAAEKLTGLTLTSFRGCPVSASFQIGEPGELTPPHPVSDKTEPTLLPGCEALTEESSYCMVDTPSPKMLGLDSGTVCSGSNETFHGYRSHSLGWAGDYIYHCDPFLGVMRTSLLDNTVDIAPIRCSAAVTYDGGLLILMDDNDEDSSSYNTYAVQFTSFENAARRQAENAFAIEHRTHNLAVSDDRIYFIGLSDTVVKTTTLKHDSNITTIPLEGWNDTITTLEVTDDGKLIIGGPAIEGSTSTLHIFDAESGKSLGVLEGDWPTSYQAIPIQCVAGGS